MYNPAMLSAEARPALKVAVTGIDGSGKSTTIQSIVDDLGTDNRIIHTASRPTYSLVEGKKQLHFRHLIGLIDKMHGFADNSQNPDLVCAVNAAHVMLQGRVIEPSLIERIKPTLVLGARDLLIDPSVYAVFYSPRLAAKSMAERIDLLSNLTGTSVRDVIFFLTVPPEEAVVRIDSRMEKEKIGASLTGREKWRHMHENAADLEKLQREYYVALDEIHRRSHVEIVEIDTSQMTQSEVGDLIKSKIRERSAQASVQNSSRVTVAAF